MRLFFLNVNHAKYLIGKRVAWQAPSSYMLYKGEDIILGVDYTKHNPIVTQNVWGDSLSFATLSNHGLVPNGDGTYKCSDTAPLCFTYSDDCREVEIMNIKPFNHVDVCLRHKTAYAKFLTTADILMDMAADSAEAVPGFHLDGQRAYYVTRNKHWYKRGCMNEYPDVTVELLGTDGKNVKELGKVAFFTEEEAAVDFAKDLLADAISWNDYNHLDVVRSRAYGEMTILGDNIPADGIGYGEWWEFLIHLVLLDNDAEHLRDAKDIKDVIIDDDDDKYLGAFTVDNPIK